MSGNGSTSLDKVGSAEACRVDSLLRRGGIATESQPVQSLDQVKLVYMATRR